MTAMRAVRYEVRATDGAVIASRAGFLRDGRRAWLAACVEDRADGSRVVLSWHRSTGSALARLDRIARRDRAAAERCEVYGVEVVRVIQEEER